MRRIVPLAAIVVVCLALGAAVTTLALPPRSAGASAVGGPFALTAADGRTMTARDMAGHPFLVFFGYTHCPDVCPATLAEISAVFEQLGPQAPVRALFVTVDPERDTPTVMGDYVSNFDPRIIGLSGTPAETTAIESAYKVFAQKRADADGTYTMDHTALTYLMDKDGHFVGGFNLDRPAKDAAAELKPYL